MEVARVSLRRAAHRRPPPAQVQKLITADEEKAAAATERVAALRESGAKEALGVKEKDEVMARRRPCRPRALAPTAPPPPPRRRCSP